MKDETKKRILARRAQLVAAAIGAASCEPKPEACLSPVVVDLPPPPDADAGMEDSGPPPLPCLSPMLAEPEDSGAPPPKTNPDAGPAPRPCLTPARNPPPRVCLTK